MNKLNHPIKLKNSLEVSLVSGEWIDVLSLTEAHQLSFFDEVSLLKELSALFTFMPDVPALSTEIGSKEEILKKSKPDSITFFSGSFFPFHMGHLACLELCPEEMIVIAPDKNPDKNFVKRQHPFFDFLKLVQIMRKTPYSIFPGFMASEVGNPTVNWLTRVECTEKNMLVGDDTFMGMSSWVDYTRLLKSIHKIYVVPRVFSSLDYIKQTELLKKINPELLIVILPDHPFRNASSTVLRK